MNDKPDYTNLNVSEFYYINYEFLDNYCVYWIELSNGDCRSVLFELRKFNSL